MKKPIIKNWIKYFTGTLAVSGMLVVGGCDNNGNNDQQDTNLETQTEAAENEIGQPTRDNVNQEVETDTYDTEEEAAQPATTEGQEANTTNDQMSNQSSAPRAQGINNFDSHLQEHSEANREITETLTERENLEDGEAAGIHRGTTSSANQYEGTDRNTYDRQSNTDFDDNDNMNRQQGTSGTNEPTQQQNTLDNEQDANIGRQGTTTQQGQDNAMDQQQGMGTDTDAQGTDRNTYDRQSNTDFDDDDNMNQQGSQGTQGIPQEGETYQGQDAEAEVDTDRQGTTQMSIDNQQETTSPQRDQNSPMEQQQGMGTEAQQGTTNQENPDMPQHRGAADEDDPRYENDGDDPTRAGINEQQRESEFGNQGQGQGTQTNLGTEPNNAYQQGDNQNQTDDTNMNQNQQGTTDNQQSATYHQQGNNQQMSQEDGAGVVVYERYSNTYPESYSDEDRQRTDDIMNEYETRRESMRGQMNEETGAYMAPEVDAEPREGYDQLMRQISENINYPQDAAAAEIEGTVFVNFIVDENGNIEEARAVEDVIVPVSSMEYATNPLDPTKFNEEEIEDAKEEMRKEAVRAVEATSGQWQAGQQGGESVRSEVQIPVHFDLQTAQGGGNTIDNR